MNIISTFYGNIGIKLNFNRINKQTNFTETITSNKGNPKVIHSLGKPSVLFVETQVFSKMSDISWFFRSDYCCPFNNNRDVGKK